MKKLLFIIGVLCLLLAACGEKSAAEPAPSDYVTTSDAARAVADYLGWSDLAPLEQEDRDFYINELYGLEEGAWTEAAIYAAQGVDARELAVLRLSDGENAETVATVLEEYRKNRQGDFFGYFPKEAALVEKGMAVIVDGYVALLICDESNGAASALAAVLRGEELPEPVNTPSPTSALLSPNRETTQPETPSPSPTPTPTPDASPDQSTEPAPSSTAEAEPTSTPGVSSFFPFNPPNSYHVKPYSTTFILEAYASGDESGLSERDAAILARCKEGLECITEDMTDFEKELALRDWMLEQGEYDETVLNGKSHRGQKDNTNPYGYLVNGYGICRGYASTFQLLMDLAGVECITVVGAAFHSTEDHAWNMVKLEDEWYCVDTTWDLNGGYTYFNVTSDYMRQSDHQWDYENVPEATGTRFHWNGFGKKPE